MRRPASVRLEVELGAVRGIVAGHAAILVDGEAGVRLHLTRLRLVDVQIHRAVTRLALHVEEVTPQVRVDPSSRVSEARGVTREAVGISGLPGVDERAPRLGVG